MNRPNKPDMPYRAGRTRLIRPVKHTLIRNLQRL